MSAEDVLRERVSEFETRGFTVIEGVLSRAEAQAMRPTLLQAIEQDLNRWDGKPGYIDRAMVHNLMMRGDCFAKVMDNERLHQFLDAAFTPHCIVYAYQSSSMPPGAANYSRRIHVDCPRLIPGYPTNVAVIVALDDFSEDNGATYMLPGSHLSGAVPTEAEFMSKSVRVTPRAGDAIVFNARVWHMGGENKTSEWRHAITMNICRPFMKQRFDFPRMVPTEVIEKLGPKGRGFLGMNARVPASLDEYYVPAEKRLYKGGLE